MHDGGRRQVEICDLFSTKRELIYVKMHENPACSAI